ncbi:Yip1 family protein [Thioalkalivibrio sp. XN8]|uniref:Yip1 family protein n=1 Tax=Thioalkalivibrio sp. XN8 TaxID=2712863 RepID=UPI0013EC1928|nr:Yip1 family protein [Thioalkalivibrio sp. XN8]NGP54449.1 YIP1 family protein [Thioalkalivibrio sp. XN8]
MLNLNRTFSLIRGALFAPEATWRGYLPEADNWQKTAFLLTGPLIILAAVLGYVLGLLFSGAYVVGFRPTIGMTLLSIVFGAIAAGIVAFIVSTLAGLFGGKRSFALGLAATSLAFVPGYLGQALRWLPWIGGLVFLVLFIYALVLLWRIIPLYLEVPAGRRVGHYILTLIATVVVMVLIGLLLRPVIGPEMSGLGDYADVQFPDGDTSGVGGVMGGAIRQAERLAAAEEDRYAPPANGKLEENQVKEYVRVMIRARDISAENAERLQALAERADRNERMSLSDMNEMMRGGTQMMGMNTIELEVVKSGGGNWAEHQWVREALRTAYFQRDTDAVAAHNYQLFKKYEDELAQFIAR